MQGFGGIPATLPFSGGPKGTHLMVVTMLILSLGVLAKDAAEPATSDDIKMERAYQMGPGVPPIYAPPGMGGPPGMPMPPGGPGMFPGDYRDMCRLNPMACMQINPAFRNAPFYNNARNVGFSMVTLLTCAFLLYIHYMNI